MAPDINCVEHCPVGFVAGNGGICQPENNERWYEIVERTIFPREYTLHMEAKSHAGVLLDAGDLIIGHDYIIQNGMRHDFADATCNDSICTYTTSVGAYSINHYVNDDLVGTVEKESGPKINTSNKVIGDQVVFSKIFWGSARKPMKVRPSRRLQTGECSDKCGATAVGVGCRDADSPTGCLFCREDLYIYDAGSTSNSFQGTYFLCVRQCGTGLDVSENPNMCTRNPDVDDMWLWQKFWTPEGTNYADINQSVRGIDSIGGVEEGWDYLDPYPAYQRGLYFTGYSSFLQFHNMNLGTDFTFGAWFKPFLFDSVFAVYTPFPELEPRIVLTSTTENGLLTFAWKVYLEGEGETFTIARNPADPSLSSLYPILNTWFLCSLRINANPREWQE